MDSDGKLRLNLNDNVDAFAPGFTSYLAPIFND